MMSAARTPSLALRLLATYLAALLLTTALVAGVVFALVTWRMDLLIRQYLDHEIAMLDRRVRFDADGLPRAVDLPADVGWYFAALATDLKFRVLDPSGATRVSSDVGGTALVPAGERFDAGRPLFAIVIDGVTFHVLTEPVARAPHGYVLQAAASDRLATLVRLGFGASVLRAVVLIVGGSVALLAVALYFTQRRLLRPLREASTAAALIEPRKLAARLRTDGLPTELAPLIEAFNAALGRLEAGFRVQQDFLAAAAHELKTPLALIRGQIEQGGGEADRPALLRDVDFMARQVHQLLHLAEVSEPQNFVFEAVDVGAVATDVVAWAERLADRRSVHLDLRCATATPPLRADRSALHVLLKNLVENAVRHSPEGGVVSVVADGHRVVVRDQGTGIAAEHLPHLFVRFWRGPERRDDGAGLGLAICREIADAHGWRLEARDTGDGAEFELGFGRG